MVNSGNAVAVAMMVEREELECDGASVATRSVLKGVPCFLGANQGLTTIIREGLEEAAATPACQIPALDSTSFEPKRGTFDTVRGEAPDALGWSVSRRSHG
jgi:hypothetical protein